jgi:hypothetical protein
MIEFMLNVKAMRPAILGGIEQKLPSLFFRALKSDNFQLHIIPESELNEPLHSLVRFHRAAVRDHCLPLLSEIIHKFYHKNSQLSLDLWYPNPDLENANTMHEAI